MGDLIHYPRNYTLFRALLGFTICHIFLIAPLSQARLLQIIHTNDLHSHFKEAEDRSLAGTVTSDVPKGSYAALKAKIDEIKAKAHALNIDTLVLDAGDFSEGTEFYFADQGKKAWEMMNVLGYDAVALGNHDYLMGLKELNDLTARAYPNFPLLCANFKASSKYENLNVFIQPSVSYERAGVKIAILGLTTDDYVYTWRAGLNWKKGGRDTIRDPIKIAKKLVPKLRKDHDLVIALTHLGVDADQELVKKVNGIDLVIGGHSHTFLTEYIPATSDAAHGTPRKVVPIVQAGQHAEVVGDLLVDVEPGKPLHVVHYHLIPVMKNGPKDETISHLEHVATEDLDDSFNRSWLHEVIGYSDVPLLRPDTGRTEWGDIVADSMREAISADLSFDAGGSLFGDNQPSGEITREKLFRFYPRVFSLREHRGWTIWKVEAFGWVLKVALESALAAGYSMNLSGAIIELDNKHKIQNFTIGGKPYEPSHLYTVALPEGIGRAVKEVRVENMLELGYKFALLFPKDTKIPIWTAIENKLRQMGGMIGQEPNHTGHHHLFYKPERSQKHGYH